MINIRTAEEIEKIRTVCALASDTMAVLRGLVAPGVSTGELGDAAKVYIESHGGKAAFLDYHGYPGAICVSVNDEVVHGIPGDRRLRDGDIVKLDIGTYLDGFYGDMTRSFGVGTVSPEARALMEATEASLYEGIERAVPGNHVNDIGAAIQQYVESRGYSVVRALVGHGIGRDLHEEPQVPNFGREGEGPLLRTGMVLAIEPMVNAGVWKVKTLRDEWTVVTADGSLSAHYENTCVIGENGPEVLTLMDGEHGWRKTMQ